MKIKYKLINIIHGVLGNGIFTIYGHYEIGKPAHKLQSFDRDTLAYRMAFGYGVPVIYGLYPKEKIDVLIDAGTKIVNMYDKKDLATKG